MLNTVKSVLPLALALLAAAAAASDSNWVVSSGEIRLAGLHGAAATSKSDAAAADAGRSVPYFPSASDPLGREGFVRVVNLENQGGTASITAYDDAGQSRGPITLTLDALETQGLNSGDIEQGNTGKGLPVGVGPPSEGDWRLELASDLDVKVLSYIRTSDGFVTSMHDVAPVDSNVHGVAFFNPGSNNRQQSLLRVVNPGSGAASVTVGGVDDGGDAAPGGAVRFSIPPRAARTLSAADLEDGATGLSGALGDGAGKWRLRVEADVPVQVMSLLATPTGHLTNLSTDPGESPPDGRLPAPVVEVTGAREFEISWKWSGNAGQTYAFELEARLDGGAWEEILFGGDCPTVTFSQTMEDVVVAELSTRSDLSAGTVIEARYRYRNASSCGAGSPGDWSRIGRATVSGLAPPDQAAFDAGFVGKQLLLPDLAGYSLDFVSAGRFRETEGGSTYTGSYTYRNTGADTGELVFAYDDGDRCVVTITFETATSGTADSTCLDVTVRWRVADIPASGAPDLVVESASVDDNAPAASASFTLKATVRNRGDGQSDSTTLRYYRSSNSTISTTDSEVGTDPVGRLAAAATSAESISLTAPSSAGTYYYGACVDAVSGESSTANNCSDGVRVDVTGGGTGGDSYCRPDDVIPPGGECEIYSTTITFDVDANGRACVRAGGILNCSGSGTLNVRNAILNGVRITFVASHNNDNSWTIEDVDPKP